VASVAREVFSSGELHRPQLDAMIARLTPGDVLLTHKPDRLSRHQKHPHILEYLIEQKGARLAYVTQRAEMTEEDILLSNVGNYTSASERARIRERTQGGRRARIASGKPNASARPPYGYVWADAGTKKGGRSRLVLDPVTAPVVRDIFNLALSGMALRGIASDLTERGILAPSGGTRWSATTIREILGKQVYTGTAQAFQYRYDRQPGGRYKRRPAAPEEQVALPDVAPAIVSEAELAAVLARLQRNRAESTRRNPNPEATLLRCGHVFCGHCGLAMTVVNRAPSELYRKPTYRCRSRHKGAHDCPQPSLTAELVDGVVWEQVSAILRDPSVIAREVDRHRKDGGLDRDLSAVEARLAGIAKKQANLAAIAADMDPDAAAPLIAQLSTLAMAKAAADRERGDLVARIASAEAEVARVQTLADWCATVSTNLDALDYAGKRAAIDALGVEVRIWREGATDETGKPLPRWLLSVEPVDLDIVNGHTHHAAALEVEGDLDRLPVAAIELGDGIAGGGVEAKRLHGSSSVSL
jgi:site-specific DNA recombinase